MQLNIIRTITRVGSRIQNKTQETTNFQSNTGKHEKSPTKCRDEKTHNEQRNIREAGIMRK